MQPSRNKANASPYITHEGRLQKVLYYNVKTVTILPDKLHCLESIRENTPCKIFTLHPNKEVFHPFNLSVFSTRIPHAKEGYIMPVLQPLVNFISPNTGPAKSEWTPNWRIFISNIVWANRAFSRPHKETAQEQKRHHIFLP